MYHLLKKYRRQLLAVASALLMVAFLIPTVNKQSGRDYSVGTLDGKKVTAIQRQNADAEWSLLKGHIFVQAGYQMAPIAATMGPEINRELEQHREMFMLLKLEAHKLGVYIPEERLSQELQRVRTSGLDMTNPRDSDMVKAAMQSFLQIVEAYNRTTSAVRVPQPMVQHGMATMAQQIKVGAVDFPAVEFASKVSAPTPAQLKEFFERYKDVTAESPTALTKENPFGFGYCYPERVTFQCITIPTAQVRQVVVASRDAYTWEKAAFRYYDEHQGQFQATTQPAPSSFENLTLSATSKPAVTSTTRPFKEVHDEAMEAVVVPEVRTLQSTIVGRLNAILNQEWNAYHLSKAASKPVSSLGVAYDSYAFLQKAAEQIQKQFKVMPVVEQYPTLLTPSELALAPGIGRAKSTSEMAFPAYATLTEQIRKQMMREDAATPPVLALWQPSLVLRDAEQNAYLFRRTAVDAAHTPKDVTEVAAAVERDWRAQQAFELARKAANEFVQQAQATSMGDAATANRRSVVKTGFFNTQNSSIAMGLHLDKAQEQFKRDAMERLLGKVNAGTMNPLAVVPAYADSRVLALQLLEVKRESDLTASNLPMITEFLRETIGSELGSSMQSSWFNFKNIVKRTNWVPEQSSRKQADDDSDADTK